jgi:MarR family transcriptional regulator, transcriptional regulator for hemolysin
VLATLARSQGEKQVLLAERLDIEPIVLARIIDRLEESGYVERRADPADRRVRLLYLTDAAQPLIQLMRVIGSETGDMAFQGFSQAEIDKLAELLGRLCANLSDTFKIEGGSSPKSKMEPKT